MKRKPLPDPFRRRGQPQASKPEEHSSHAPGKGPKRLREGPSDAGPWADEASRHKFDAYLLASLMALDGACAWPDPYVPVLLRVAHPCSPRDWTDVVVTSRVADIVACTATVGALRRMLDDPEVLWVEASRRRCLPETGKSLQTVRADAVHAGSHAEKGEKCLVAVIEDGIDVMHEAFRDGTGSQTRIRYIWDQTDSTGTGPGTGNAEIDRAGGTVYDAQQINDFIAGNAVPPNRLRDPDGHGTHVASIAAGRPGTKFKGGVAPNAELVVVIPKHQVHHSDPKTLGYSNSHIAALQYIKHVANKLTRPVVVNLSGGTTTGAHDGTSLLEAAFDAVVREGREGGYVVVKSAGNEAASNTHAELRLAPGFPGTLEWSARKVPQQTTLRVELWFRSCDDFRFCLADHAGNTSNWVDRTPKASADKGTLNGNDYCITLKRYHPDNGDSQLVIQIDPGGRGEITTDRWILQIDPRYTFDGYIYAWIERTDRTTAEFTHPPRAIRVERTLTVPGTAASVITVGNADGGVSPAVASDSSYGPTRDDRRRPDVIAPGTNIEAALAGTIIEVVPMDGTSQAAAHVSGAVALLLSALEKKRKIGEPRRNAVQIRAALTQTTQTTSYQWHEATGSGLLDVQKFLTAFD